MGITQQLKPYKIGILRALQLGDLLCTIPAIRALKNQHPDSKIILIGLPWAKSFSKRFTRYFDGFIEFPGYPGLPEQNFHAKKFTAFLNSIQQEEFDLIIQMQGNGTVVNHCMPLFGSKHTAGYVLPGQYAPDHNLYMPYPPEQLNEVKKHLLLMQFLGIKTLQKDLEFPINEEEENNLKALKENYQLNNREYVCIHPGARDKKRWWPAKYFAQVADLLTSKGFTVVFTGTEPERPIVENVLSEMTSKVVNIVGKTHVGELAALIRDSRLLFSNDTGVSHIAAAVKTPSVIIFLASDPSRWAPLDKDLHRVILPEHQNNLEYIILNIEESLRADNKGKHVDQY